MIHICCFLVFSQIISKGLKKFGRGLSKAASAWLDELNLQLSNFVLINIGLKNSIHFHFLRWALNKQAEFRGQRTQCWLTNPNRNNNQTNLSPLISDFDVEIYYTIQYPILFHLRLNSANSKISFLSASIPLTDADQPFRLHPFRLLRDSFLRDRLSLIGRYF